MVAVWPRNHMTSDCDWQRRLHLRYRPPPTHPFVSLMNGLHSDASLFLHPPVIPSTARVRSASLGRWRKPSPMAAQRPRQAMRVRLTRLTFTQSPTLLQSLAERRCYGNSNHGDISTVHPALRHTTHIPSVQFLENIPHHHVIG